MREKRRTRESPSPPARTPLPQHVAATGLIAGVGLRKIIGRSASGRNRAGAAAWPA
jgi:hypothetical protein